MWFRYFGCRFWICLFIMLQRLDAFFEFLSSSSSIRLSASVTMEVFRSVYYNFSASLSSSRVFMRSVECFFHSVCHAIYFSSLVYTNQVLLPYIEYVWLVLFMIIFMTFHISLCPVTSPLRLSSNSHIASFSLL